jgi:hypothetical protein
MQNLECPQNPISNENDFSREQRRKGDSGKNLRSHAGFRNYLSVHIGGSANNVNPIYLPYEEVPSRIKGVFVS